MSDVAGKKCFDCGAAAAHLHHVVPKVLGGHARLPLCDACHTKVHSPGSSVSTSRLSRRGCRQHKKLTIPIFLELIVLKSWHRKGLLSYRNAVAIMLERHGIKLPLATVGAVWQGWSTMGRQYEVACHALGLPLDPLYVAWKTEGYTRDSGTISSVSLPEPTIPRLSPFEAVCYW